MKAVEITKARLWCLDKDAWSVDFQFNPERGSMELRRGVNWGAAGGGTGYDPWGGPLEYAQGQPDDLSFDVLFDETMILPDLGESNASLASKLTREVTNIGTQLASAGKKIKDDFLSIFGMADESEDSILPYIQDLYRLTVPIHPKDHDATTNYQLRPPICAFVWEEFEFMGAVTAVDTEFLVFNHNGMPKRAKCRISMQGRAFTGNVSLTQFLEADYTPPNATDAGGSRDTTRADILKALK